MKTKQHELKTWPDPFSAVVIDQKRHVIRQDDRGFRVGDMLWLREWDPFSKALRRALQDERRRVGSATRLVRHDDRALGRPRGHRRRGVTDMQTNQHNASPAGRVPGSRFGRLVVIGDAGSRMCGRGKRRFVLCQCDCGKMHEVLPLELVRGATKSCGCLRRTRGGPITHGLSRRPEHPVWCSMITRCDNPNSKNYPRYGGRGISVCQRWRAFEAFFKDMGPRPSPAHQLDRIDNDKGYEPGNCRWATPVEQSRNTCRTRFVEFRGETRCITEWSEITGLSKDAIRSRLERGWSVEMALTQPSRGAARIEKAGAP
jgi:hypothetical protein